MLRTVIFLASLFALAMPSSAADKKGPEFLERKLYGMWFGGDCQGDFVFGMGTFKRQNYTPGGNTITGTWELRWDALPPTLILTCKTSDAPDRLPVGMSTIAKLVQLDDEVFEFQIPGDKRRHRFTRTRE